MPLPDPEAPEKSLGDCSICMDAIYVDPSIRLQASQEQEKKEKEKNTGKGWTGDTEGGASLRRNASSSRINRNTAASAGGFFNAVQMGVAGSGRRREYSLAPCHHLFVSSVLC